MNTLRTRPKWVDEEPLVQAILTRFLDQIDRGVKPLFRINEKNTPALYDFQNEDPYYLWDLLKSLDKEYHALTIKKQRIKSGRESFENAQLFFNPDKEPLIRDWLNRPAFDPYTLNWAATLERLRPEFEDFGQALDQPLREQGKSASDILNGFALLSRQLGRAQSLRNLSAKCFWGDSKFLDHRLDLIQALFPQASATIIRRPIILNIVIPEDFDQILFIENQDSFLMLSRLVNVAHRFSRSALIYSAGFKGSARNIRRKDAVVFSTINTPSSEQIRELEQWWCSPPQENTLPCYFWGDLDYSGLAILASLRQSFTQIEAWKTGYEAMLVMHDAGAGHEKKYSKKHAQVAPKATGCAYADEVLLPLIRNSERFLDQEVVSENDLGNI